ncbi:MAG: 30S ribosomal protein S12 methylthiotransferase RimO [Pseudomonadales bacterium]|nr:30S ribosomal protein S12 methylthiotransferase RimO [Pseudomonadales bacterium]
MSNEKNKVGFVSLGCPKALVDSERIMTQLKIEGYDLVASYNEADLVVVNTCGFIDEAKAESLEAIGEAISENGRVIVTGCMGKDTQSITDIHPRVLSVTGPHEYAEVMSAVQEHLPPSQFSNPPVHNPLIDLTPAQGIKLTPKHYAYLKISEGCNHRCTFCIIPSLRGDLVSRPINEVMEEAERLKQAGVQELLIISQDTSAYGLDLKYQKEIWRGQSRQTRLLDLCNALGELDLWTRLHYVYPYPHVDKIIPLMAEGKILPYLDIPFQHGSTRVLKAMKRPGAVEHNLQRIQRWREICPEITLRSTFIVGFPGETEDEFQELIDFIEEAKLDHAGCFKYSPVKGAIANDQGEHIDDDIMDERFNIFMRVQGQISEARLQEKVGKTIDVLIDEVDSEGAIGRSKADAPEIDGRVMIDGESDLNPGDIVSVKVTEADEHDLWGELKDTRIRFKPLT